MTCPVCGGRVEVDRCYSDCESVVRKRRCVECDYKFYTEEYESNDKHFRELESYFNKKKYNPDRRRKNKSV